MLGEAELAVLGALQRGDTVADLADRLDRSESYISRVVSDLESKHLVYTGRDGRTKRIQASDARAVEVYRDLVRQYSHIDFPDILAGKALDVLYHFDEPMTVAELATQSRNYRNTVNRILARLKHRGLVGKTDSTYRFTGDFDELYEFARRLAHHLHRHRLETVAPRGTILWETHDEFLAQTDTDVTADGFFETGLPAFAEVGLQFVLTDRRYYFYSERRESLSLADICCHALLVDDDTRYRSYCLLFLTVADIDETELHERADYYGIEGPVDELLQYLDSSGDVESERLPSWDEFEDLAAEYEVTP